MADRGTMVGAGEKTGKVAQYQGLTWNGDETLFGVRIKVPSYPSFDIALKLDFGETFVQSAAGHSGTLPNAECILFGLAGFDPNPILNRQFSGPPPEPLPYGLEDIQGQFQVAGMGKLC